jgi:hypothetical protein
MNTQINVIEHREGHIIELSRIVGTSQGEPQPDARRVVVTETGPMFSSDRPNSVWSSCDEHGADDAATAQWVALGDGAPEWIVLPEGKAMWVASSQPFCRHCLQAAIESGAVVLDRFSAHATLAFMLAGYHGQEEYVRYFHGQDDSSDS